MPTVKQNNLQKIQRFSALFRVISTVLLILTLLLFLTASIGTLYGGGVTLTNFNVQIPIAPLGLPIRIALVALLALTLGLITKGLYHLIRLFAGYASGKIFSSDAARQIRQLGITAILWTLAGILWPVTAIYVAHLVAPFQWNPDALFFGLLLIVISWFHDAAAALQEENHLTI